VFFNLNLHKNFLFLPPNHTDFILQFFNTPLFLNSLLTLNKNFSPKLSLHHLSSLSTYIQNVIGLIIFLIKQNFLFSSSLEKNFKQKKNRLSKLPKQGLFSFQYKFKSA